MDADSDGQPNATASGDDLAGAVPDDEDGVVFASLLGAGSTATVDVTASAGGLLNAWVDFDGDGIFGPSEQIFTDFTLGAGLNPGLAYSVPVGATGGPSFARFRFDQAGGLTPTGLAPDGEVEDYEVTIVTPEVTVTKDDALLIDLDFDVDADPGDTLRYTVVVMNSGTIPATTLVLSDTPGVGTTLVVGSVTAGPGTVTTGNTAGDTSVAVSIGTLAPAATSTITFEVTVDTPATLPEILTQVCNQGTVTGTALTTTSSDDPATGTPADATCTTLDEGTINITKVTVPPGVTGFGFTTSLPGGPFTLDHGQTQTYTNVTPGPYSVTEDDPFPITLGSLVCVEDGGVASVADVPAFTATINLAPGETVTCTFTNIQNTPPIANAGGPYAVPEGTPSVVLSANGTFDAQQPNSELLFEWDLDDDGQFDDATGVTAILSGLAAIDGPATIPVAVRVTDAFGEMDEATASVLILNVDPTAILVPVPVPPPSGPRRGGTPPPPVGEVSFLLLIFDFFGDTHTATVDWGDGTIEPLAVDQLSDSATLSHTYATSGMFNIVVTVMDDDSGTGMAVKTVTINVGDAGGGGGARRTR